MAGDGVAWQLRARSGRGRHSYGGCAIRAGYDPAGWHVATAAAASPVIPAAPCSSQRTPKLLPAVEAGGTSEAWRLGWLRPFFEER
eukprot:scaffold2236_cov136-Isochrysis_galbana.AAC.9